MIQGVFPRNFGNFREGANLAAKFTVGGGGAAGITFTLKTLVAGTQRKVSSYAGITMARVSAGLATVSLRGTGSAQTSSLGVNDLVADTLIHIPVVPTSIANYFELLPANFNDAAGTFDFRPATKLGVLGAEFAMANGDEIHVLLYVNK